MSPCHTFTQNFLFSLREKDRFCTSAAAADAYAEQHFVFYR